MQKYQNIIDVPVNYVLYCWYQNINDVNVRDYLRFFSELYFLNSETQFQLNLTCDLIHVAYLIIFIIAV